MNYQFIINPLIGAGIGYVTNWIAIKMMFRPTKAIKIGKFTLPFTPGIIPKNRSRLAEAIGNTISNNLLTENDLKDVLLSDEIKSQIQEKIEEYISSLSSEDMTLEDFINLYVEKDSYDKTMTSIQSNLTKSILQTVIEANLGAIISEQIEIAANEKMKGSFIGLIGGKSLVSSLSSNITTSLNKYIEENGEEVISGMVKKELEKYTSQNVVQLSSKLSGPDNNIVSTIMNIYEKIISEKITTALKSLNISKIIANKINSMEVLELERLLLKTIKKELDALVNLGAVIGFILGFLNLLV